MKHEITKNGWLIAANHRIRLDIVERYEKREGKVVLQSAEWGCIIDCDPDPNFMARHLPGLEDKTPEKKQSVMSSKDEQRLQASEAAAAIVAALDAHFAKSDGKVEIRMPSP